MKKSILIYIAFLAFSSCEKSLELQPYAELSEVNALKDASSIESCVNGIYLKAGWALYYNGYKSYGDYLGDLLQPVDNSQADVNYFRSETRTGTWDLGWQCVNSANMVIEAIDNGNAGTDSNADRMKGEALFWKATMMFELTREYGPQYDVSTLDKDAIMIYNKPVRDYKGGPLQPVGVCYEQIIADLTEASVLLPTDYEDGVFPASYKNVYNRVVKDAALSMLARVSFQKGTTEGYTDAVNYINQVIGVTPGEITTNRKLATNLKSLFSLQGIGQKGTNPEIIVQLSNLEFRGYNTGFPFSVTSYSTPTYMVNDSFLSYTSAIIDTQYIKNNEDKRIKDFYEIRKDKKSNELYILVRKYDIATIGYMNFPYLRVGELLLTRAESEWNIGNYTNAFLDYKLLKSRSKASSSNEVQGSNEALLDSIQQERLRELVLEGDRFYDLLRQRAFIPGGSPDVAEFNWDAPRAICRIPDSELIRNPYLSGY
jgi:hypothetical protein